MFKALLSYFLGLLFWLICGLAAWGVLVDYDYEAHQGFLSLASSRSPASASMGIL